MSTKTLAKQAVEEERQACVNVLHFALKTCNDDEWLSDTHLLCHMTEPEV